MRSPRSLLSLALVLACGTLWATTASAQVPEPVVRDVNQRSGLLTRFTPVGRTLPPDADRDQWYDTYWGDHPKGDGHINCYKNGGLYGLQYGNRCTASVYPFFRGAPGASTICSDCEPPKHELIRLYDNFLHPWRPVGMYYQKGSYVPIYDLDPIVPGPGPFPFRHFFNAIKGG